MSRILEYVVPAIAAAALTGTVIVAVHSASFRTLASAHGLLHTAIAQTFESGWTSFGQPEDPFFAGERLPYYWFYHYAAARVVAAADVHPLRAFEWLGLLAVCCVWFGGAALGRELGWRRGPALAIGALVFAGSNMLGSVILLAKVVARVPWPPDDGSYLWALTHPVMAMVRYNDTGALYGPLINFYFNNSSRALALSLVLVTVWAMTRLLSRGSLRAAMALVLASALTTAFSPIIGLASGLALAGGLGAERLIPWPRRWVGESETRAWSTGRAGATALALLAGVALPLPTYVHLFARAGGAGTEVSVSSGALVTILVSGGPLLGLAAAGLAGRPARLRVLMVLAAAGGALLVLSAVTRLPAANESNFFHVAMVLYAVPAAGVLMHWQRLVPALRVIVLVGAASATATALLVVAAYWDRPPLPLELEGRDLRPADPAEAALYAWIRSETPAHSVFVVDETWMRRNRVGNVPEFPALARRTLFVSVGPGYVVDVFADADLRRAIARRLDRAEPLDADQRRLIGSLGRPVWLVADSSSGATLPQLGDAHGPPAFAAGTIAVYRLDLRP